METPHLPKAIFGSDLENVYEPAEDTFLLLDALEKDLDLLKGRGVQICLECGSGSGTIITALSKALNKNGATLMFATDINDEACKVTRKCATYHNQHGIQVIRTSLSDALMDRLEGAVDLLVFNPPYVPTSNDELVKADSGNKIYLSWAGGEKGRKLIDTFLKVHVTRLLSKPYGTAYMVALDQNNIDDLLNYLLTDHGIKGSIVIQRKAGIESLSIIKYEWIN